LNESDKDLEPIITKELQNMKIKNKDYEKKRQEKMKGFLLKGGLSED
jgi:hypothetical protein